MPASLLLALALAAPPSEPDPPPLQTAPVADPRAAAARAAYAAGDYVSAARQYEALARDTAAPKYLFNAGMAREAARELSLAVLRWHQYLASGTAPDDDRALLARKLAAADASLFPRRFTAPPAASVRLSRAGDHDPLDLDPALLAAPVLLEAGAWTAQILSPTPTPPIHFTVTPGDAPPITLAAPAPATPPPTPPTPTPTGTLTLHLGPPRALRSGVSLTLSGPDGPRTSTQRTPESTWTLPHGPWKISASAHDHSPQSLDTTVDASPRRLDLLLRPSPAARWLRIGVPASLGALSLGLAVGGSVLLARANRHGFACTDLASCNAATNAVLDVSNGLSLLGTSIGAVIPAVTAGVGAKHRALAIEASLGAALFAGGLSWYVAEAAGTTALDHRPREHAAATMLGLGAGMSGGALLALLVRRALRRSTLQAHRPTLAPLATGLSLHAKF